MSRYGWARLAIVLGAGAILELLCRAGVISPVIMIPPSEMLASAWQIIASGEFNQDIGISVINIGIAIGVSVSAGFLLGLAIFNLPAVRETLEPFLASYYSVPPIVFYPLLIVVFGLNRIPQIIIAVLFGLVTMIINTITGLDRIRPVLLKVGRVHQASPLAVIFRIKLPAAAPYLFIGVTLAVSYSIIGVISSEFIMSAYGIGHQISYAYDNFDNRTMYGLIVLLLGIAALLNMILHAYSERLLRRWSR